MEITDIRLRIIRGDSDSKLKAYADLTFDGSFVIHGLKVIDGQKGMFVAMPSRKMTNGDHKDIVHPITLDLRKKITDSVIRKYNEVKELDIKKVVLE